jgi:hypothetical protein
VDLADSENVRLFDILGINWPLARITSLLFEEKDY